MRVKGTGAEPLYCKYVIGLGRGVPQRKLVLSLIYLLFTNLILRLTGRPVLVCQSWPFATALASHCVSKPTVQPRLCA